MHCYPIEPKALHKILFQPRDGSDKCDEARIAAHCLSISKYTCESYKSFRALIFSCFTSSGIL